MGIDAQESSLFLGEGPRVRLLGNMPEYV